MKQEVSDLMWYVVHTYSGHEKKVQASLMRKVDSLEMTELIQEVKVPMEEVTTKKDGKLRTKERKIFPGYVVVRMVMNDDTWYVVRNTRGVTGFVGPGSKPVPLTQEELRYMGIVDKKPNVKLDFSVGEHVSIIDGPFSDSEGVIKQINHDKGIITVSTNMFGRETPVELEAHQIQKL